MSLANVVNLTKKNLITVALTVIILVVVASSLPSSRITFIALLKHPLAIMTLIRREFSGLIFYHRNLVENERLQLEAGIVRSKLGELEEARRENLRLKELLSFKQKAVFKVIPARVIARPADSWSSAVIIDKGRSNGIRRGMAVITPAGLVGRVVEAADSVSKVLLINDPSLGVSAIVQRSRQEGLVAGTLGSSLIMKYLPEGSDIKPDDTVITSGLSQIYPKGVLIGTVVDVGKEFSGLNSYAVVRPAVPLSNIEEVLVVIP